MAVNLKGFDANQVLRSVFDVDKNTLRVSIVDGSSGGGSFEVVISHTDDSIRLGNGTDYFTSTYVGPKIGLDVGVVNLPPGASTEAKQDALLAELQLKADLTETQPVSAASLPLPAGASTSALQTTGNTSLASIDSKLNTLGQKAMTGSVPVTIASDQTPLVAGSAAITTVSVTAASTLLLAANPARKGASFYNDGGAVVYLKLGTAASTSSFTVRLLNNDFYELSYPLYTGIIHAIAGSGSRDIRVTELT